MIADPLEPSGLSIPHHSPLFNQLRFETGETRYLMDPVPSKDALIIQADCCREFAAIRKPVANRQTVKQRVGGFSSPLPYAERQILKYCDVGVHGPSLGCLCRAEL